MYTVLKNALKFWKLLLFCVNSTSNLLAAIIYVNDYVIVECGDDIFTVNILDTVEFVQTESSPPNNT